MRYHKEQQVVKFVGLKKKNVSQFLHTWCNIPDATSIRANIGYRENGLYTRRIGSISLIQTTAESRKGTLIQEFCKKASTLLQEP